jgi:hypothetical protein
MPKQGPFRLARGWGMGNEERGEEREEKRSENRIKNRVRSGSKRVRKVKDRKNGEEREG